MFSLYCLQALLLPDRISIEEPTLYHWQTSAGLLANQLDAHANQRRFFVVVHGTSAVCFGQAGNHWFCFDADGTPKASSDGSIYLEFSNWHDVFRHFITQKRTCSCNAPLCEACQFSVYSVDIPETVVTADVEAAIFKAVDVAQLEEAWKPLLRCDCIKECGLQVLTSVADVEQTLCQHGMLLRAAGSKLGELRSTRDLLSKLLQGGGA